MQSFDLNCKGWDFEHLEVEQAIELLANMQAHILFPFDAADRAAHVHTFNSQIRQLYTDKGDKHVGVQFLKRAVATIPNKQKASIERVQRTTSYLCRLITHHDSDLVRNASVRKAQYLVEKWAEGEKRGFSKKSLEQDWQRYKILAPLITANLRSGDRANTYIKLQYKDAEFAIKARARITELIADAPTALAEAMHIQDLLTSYQVWGGETPLDAKKEILFPKSDYPITPKVIRWEPISEKEMAALKEEYWRDRMPIEDAIKAREKR